MAEDDKKAVVVVIPVADLDVPAEPSTQVACGRCGVTCWLGESTARAVSHFAEHEYVCMGCMAQDFIAQGSPDEMRSPWGAVPESMKDDLVRWTIDKYGI